jgi:hypothetical protein
VVDAPAVVAADVSERCGAGVAMTTWVMVPIPEELERQVSQFLMFLGMKAGATQWNAELIDTHLRGLEPEAQTLACAVARSVIAGTTPADTELADRLRLSKREVLALAQELNEIALEPSPGVLLYALRESALGQESRTGRFFHMDNACAALICEWADTRDSSMSHQP